MGLMPIWKEKNSVCWAQARNYNLIINSSYVNSTSPSEEKVMINASCDLVTYAQESTLLCQGKLKKTTSKIIV